MSETATLWEWSVYWVCTAVFILGCAIWTMIWSLKKIRTAFAQANRQLWRFWPLALMVSFQYAFVAACAGVVLFFLTQQLLFRFSTVSVNGAYFVFRSQAGLELARYQRDAPLEVFISGQNKRTGHLEVKSGSAPVLLSINTQDAFALARIQRLLAEGKLRSGAQSAP